MAAPTRGESHAFWDGQDGERLTVTELAAVTKAAMKLCATTPDLYYLPDLLIEAARELRRAWLTDYQVRQVARVVAEAGRLVPEAKDDDPLTVVQHAIEADPKRRAVVLHGLLCAAWLLCDEQVRLSETAVLTDAERLSLEFERVTLAGRLYLVLHNPRNGRSLLAEHICSIGLAGALLTECLLAGLVVLDPDTDTLALPSEPREVLALSSAEARRVAELVGSEPPTHVPEWLAYLSQGAYKAVSSELLESGVLTARAVHRRSGRAVPSNPHMTERVRNSATVLQPLDATRFDLTTAALIALVRATGLSTAERESWWAIRLTPFEQALDRLPGLPQLITHTGAAVTTAVAAAHH
jgi:hypothetical protein